MERVFKSKVGWLYHFLILMMVGGCVVTFLQANIALMGVMLLAMLLVIHMLFNTYYKITEDEMLIAHCSFFPEKKIAIADITYVESTVMPVSSYALSLDRLIIYKGENPWMLISPNNKVDFVKQLRKINPEIKIK